MKKIIKWIAILIIVAALGVKFAIIVNRNTSVAASSALRTTVVENQDPVRCGRIVLSGRPQGFAIPKGYTYLVVPVDNSVIATKIVNGNLDVGKIILCRTGEGRPLKAYKTVGDVECVAYVAEGSEIGKSIAFAVFPIGYTLPKEWVGKTLLQTM